MTIHFRKYTLQFKQPGGTSRGILRSKDTYILIAADGERRAYGEAALFRGLSADDRPNYEEVLGECCGRLLVEGRKVLQEYSEWPSVVFGCETLLFDVQNGFRQVIFPKAFSEAGFTVRSNGLVWMGTKSFMLEQIKQKLNEGFTSIKLKIGAIDFETEIELIRFIRKQFSTSEVEVRLDANGAFTAENALSYLHQLSAFGISYVEQPIKAGQWQEMARIIEQSPVPIALDEELIGHYSIASKRKLMETLQPHLIVLKPALAGGFEACDDWKKLAGEMGGDWVITSALESNIGLNAIAQYAAAEPGNYAQGLGTGMLFTNNFGSPYTFDANGLHYHQQSAWNFEALS